MSNELPEMLRVNLAKNLDGDRSEKGKKKWSECCDKPRRDKRQGEGTEVGPSTTRSLTIGDFFSLGGIKMDSSLPTTGLRHYRPQYPKTKRIHAIIVERHSIPSFIDMMQDGPSCSTKC